jgi:hypothetical protein
MLNVAFRAAIAGFATPAIDAKPALAATARDTMLVLVSITGAVQRSGGYEHEGDATHKCTPAFEIPPGPAPGSQFLNTPFVVDFDSASRPPGNSFRLELPFVSPARGVQNEPSFRVAMTAGGRFWQGDSTTGTGAFATNDQGVTGSFKITGLHSAGSTDAISVEGTWSCPPAP